MNLKNRPPIFVPIEYRDEVEKLSKAALMDIVWDMAVQLTPPDNDGGAPPASDVIGIIRHEAEVICSHRARESPRLHNRTLKSGV